jgi:glycosyltransferase involved in cell wall biosynthesis
MRFFLSEVWPKVKRIMPEVRFDIIGKDFPADLSPLLDEAVTVHGLVPDLNTIFPSIRVCLAPLRFGAGLKGKLATSLSYAVPSVVSPIAVEGMGMVDGVHALVADTPDEWVEQIQRLYSDETFWQQISAQGLAFAEREYSMGVNRDRFQRLFDRLRAVPEHL